MAARLKLPHIPRFISATILPDMANFILWACLIALISLNVVLYKNNPISIKPTGLPAGRQVLGATTTNQSAYWNSVLATYPDYRDAYVELAGLSYKQGNLTLTKAYLTQAAALDPNGQAIKNLLGFISKIPGK